MSHLYRVQIRTRLGRQIVARCLTLEEAQSYAREWDNPLARTTAHVLPEVK